MYVKDEKLRTYWQKAFEAQRRLSHFGHRHAVCEIERPWRESFSVQKVRRCHLPVPVTKPLRMGLQQRDDAQQHMQESLNRSPSTAMATLNSQHATPINVTGRIAAVDAHHGSNSRLGWRRLIFAAFMLLASSSTYGETVLISNLASAALGDGQVAFNTSTALALTTGFSWTNGSSGNGEIKKFDLSLFRTGGQSAVTYDVYLETASRTPNPPDTRIATLASGISSASLGTTADSFSTFYYNGDFTNGVPYFVTVVATAGTFSDLAWGVGSKSIGTDPTTSNSIGEAYRSPSGGGWISTSTDPLGLRITAVPEPSTYAMLMAGGVAAVMYRRRRRG